MEHKIIKGLDINDMKILKQLIIISDRNNGESELGRILYTRDLTSDYTLKKESDNNDKQGLEVEQLIKGLPQQKQYPSDRLDEIVLSAVTKYFPKSYVRNDTIIFNVDLDKITIMKKRNPIKSTIYFSPEFLDMADAYKYAGKEFEAPGFKIHIYSNYSTEVLIGLIFYANYKPDEREILPLLKTLKFE